MRSRHFVRGVATLFLVAMFVGAAPPEWLKWTGIALVAVLCLYVGARLITAAYFQSKRQYDERNYP